MPLRPTPLALLTSLLIVSAARAQSDAPPLVTDRPDFTESAVTVASRVIQVEGGYTFARTGDVESHALGELLLRVGLAARVELRVGLNSYVFEDAAGVGEADGFEDVFLGAKVKLLDGGGLGSAQPDLALLAGSSLPTGSGAFGSEELNPEIKLALGWDLSSRLSLGSNLNFASVHGEAGRFEQLSGSIAVGAALLENVGAYIELFGFSKEEEGGSEVSFLNGGATFLLDDDFQLDARAGIGLNDIEPEYFVGFGAAWRLRL